MGLKIIMAISVLAGFRFLYSSFNGTSTHPEPPIDTTWWNGLTEEWRNVLVINQNIDTHGADLFQIQTEYINRMREAHQPGLSEMNRSLHDLNDASMFILSYHDLYARALRTGHVPKTDSINLETLADLDTLYMVNGPADLSPLRKFKHLKVLIMNFCGNDYSTGRQPLDLEPLRHLKELKVLQCVSSRLKSLDPIRNLLHLEALSLNNTGITDLRPIKNLVRLKKLSFGSDVRRASVVSRLVNLEELYMKGCARAPNLSGLKKLRKLAIAESEMSLISGAYRINDLGFLKSATNLEFLDLRLTSYRGNLSVLYGLQKLRAVTLPPVGGSEISLFKEARKECVVLNSF
jgi:hypothetical protein